MQSGQERSRPLFDVTLFSKKFAELILCAFPANKLSFISFAAVSQVNSRQLISSTSTDFASCIFTTLDSLNVFLNKCNVFFYTGLINIRGDKLTVVVTNASFVDTSAYTSLNMHFSFRRGASISFISHATINAKILLSLPNGATKAFAAAVPLHPFLFGLRPPVGIGRCPIYYSFFPSM